MDIWVWTAVAFISVLFVLDRLLSAMESRGWIYWRRTKMRRSGGASNALQELQSFFQPGQQHVIEAWRDEHADQDQNGFDSDAHRRGIRMVVSPDKNQADK